MKFGKSKNKEKSSSGKNDKVPPWMLTDPDEIKAANELHREQMQFNRPPEFWLKDGESRTIRFRKSNPIASFGQYSVRVNGRWRRVTKPAEGDKDLFEEKGLLAQYRAIYEIVDRTGYIDKNKKRVKDRVCFFSVPMKIYEQIEKIREKRGGLIDRDYEITKTGSGKTSSMMMMPEDESPMPSKLKELPSLRKDIMKYYAPPSLKEQKVLLGKLAEDDDDDDE